MSRLARSCAARKLRPGRCTALGLRLGYGAVAGAATGTPGRPPWWPLLRSLILCCGQLQQTSTGAPARARPPVRLPASTDPHLVPFLTPSRARAALAPPGPARLGPPHIATHRPAPPALRSSIHRDVPPGPLVHTAHTAHCAPRDGLKASLRSHAAARSGSCRSMNRLMQEQTQTTHAGA
jgi:hypothetical protein